MLMEWRWEQVMGIVGNSLRTRYKIIIQGILLMCYWDLYMNIGYQTKKEELFCSLYPIASKTGRKKWDKKWSEERELGNKKKKIVGIQAI
jgi:hypothetical protein